MKVPASRKSYTLKFKLAVVRDLETPKEDKSMKTKSEIVSKYNISFKMLTDWLRRKDDLIGALEDHSKSLATMRRISSGCRTIPYPELDLLLKEWIYDRNKKGLVVKDKYLKKKALTIARELSISGFTCSGGFIDNFKKRHDLVSRVHTSCRVLPVNAKALAVEFIKSTREIINRHDIKLKNIINFDQVPRYFEQENNRTIIPKGTRNVKIAKANNTHARFTYTPIIAADGRFIGGHCLFSHLKKIPKDINKGVFVDVNQTGMWGEELVASFIEKHILSRPETRFAREPVLLIIDSFSAHLKLAGRYEKFNVHISFVPKGMTPLLQMLDVSINRSFQQYYADRINEWMENQIEDDTNRTKAGNIKKPSYKMVSDICYNFSKEIKQEMIRKSFEICGISKEDYDINLLHGPLKTLLEDEMVLEEDLFL